MSKEVTVTTCKVAEMGIKDGKPVVVDLGEASFLGNLSQAKLLKEAKKRQGHSVMVYDVTHETNVYEMEVEEFMKYATLKTDDSDE